MNTPQAETLDIESAVKERYAQAAVAAEASLCCPVMYDPKHLEAIPREVIERDYGCGNPAEHLRAGETVLDLGSGAGKICFIASQVVGSAGSVIGVDMNDEMLALARRSAPEVARHLGYANVTFAKGRIQNLVEAGIANDSIDVVVSNCVLNLVRPEDKRQLFAEIFRVLRRGGRAVISDIVSDEDVPEAMQQNADLWSGCISGAFREDKFLEAFEAAGFYGVTLAARDEAPWRTVEGIEFRSVTIVAFKGKEGPCFDQKHAVIYRGPFREVVDDDGHVFRRGVRTAVCEKTFHILSREPYREHVELILPRVLVPLEEAPPFPCSDGARLRDPRETKGVDYRATTLEAANACAPKKGDGRPCC
ncbi:MAG: methyltransferase domain-containing protein [Deltaproteobacteria bacterium]|nr:methyltransferase domain-containing protein [Deltaproteobacteria bacterium]